MHPALQNIASELDQLAAGMSAVPAGQPFGIAHGNWAFPILTSEELRERIEEIAKDIRERGKDVLEPTVEGRLSDYPRRIAFMRGNTVPNLWSNAQVGVSAMNEGLDALVRALRPALAVDLAQDASLRLSKLRRQVSAFETRMQALQPRTMSLEEMVGVVEETYTAALELPSGLEEVRHAKASVGKTQAEVDVHLVKIQDAYGQASTLLGDLERFSKQAAEFIDGCESAYRSSVARGLAAAFLERSQQLNKNMWFWVGGLVASLAAGVFWGGSKIQDLAAAAHAAGPLSSSVVFDAFMAAISVAAPIWFAWLATRQVGQTFRLSEDYAYKASVARSYEGYRKEAASIDDGLVAELLTSAIRRLDEQPLRVVEHNSPGSPWHDLASSPAVSKALNTMPEFASQIRAMAAEALKRDKANKSDSAPP